jgi:hypothetical protein
MRKLMLASLAVGLLCSSAIAFQGPQSTGPVLTARENAYILCVTGREPADFDFDGTCQQITKNNQSGVAPSSGGGYVRIVWWDAAGNKHENTTPGVGAVDIHYWLSPTLVQDVYHGGNPTTYTVDKPFVGDWHPIH